MSTSAQIRARAWTAAPCDRGPRDVPLATTAGSVYVFREEGSGGAAGAATASAASSSVRRRRRRRRGPRATSRSGASGSQSRASEQASSSADAEDIKLEAADAGRRATRWRPPNRRLGQQAAPWKNHPLPILGTDEPLCAPRVQGPAPALAHVGARNTNRPINRIKTQHLPERPERLAQSHVAWREASAAQGYASTTTSLKLTSACKVKPKVGKSYGRKSVPP